MLAIFTGTPVPPLPSRFTEAEPRHMHCSFAGNKNKSVTLCALSLACAVFVTLTVVGQHFRWQPRDAKPSVVVYLVCYFHMYVCALGQTPGKDLLKWVFRD